MPLNPWLWIPTPSEALLAKAECLCVLLRWSEAIEAYQATILLNPAQCDARNNLAGLLAQSGNVDGAERELKAIVQINPEYPGVEENLNQLQRLRHLSVPPNKPKD